MNSEIYAIGRSNLYHSAFHDITEGNNTVVFPSGTVTGYSARPGWDPVTGWGSPDVQVLVPLLAQRATHGVALGLAAYPAEPRSGMAAARLRHAGAGSGDSPA